jgi:hypothetical protein
MPDPAGSGMAGNAPAAVPQKARQGCAEHGLAATATADTKFIFTNALLVKIFTTNKMSA